MADGHAADAALDAGPDVTGGVKLYRPSGLTTLNAVAAAVLGFLASGVLAALIAGAIMLLLPYLGRIQPWPLRLVLAEGPVDESQPERGRVVIGFSRANEIALLLALFVAVVLAATFAFGLSVVIVAAVILIPVFLVMLVVMALHGSSAANAVPTPEELDEAAKH